jgi:sigma-B regulation protein RsbU (phosphoserine phosphatase)
MVTLRIEPGDLLVVLTDGIEEAMSAEDELFGRARVFDVVQQNCRESAADIIRALLEAVRKFRKEQLDDATAIAVKFGEPTGLRGGGQ